jgi:hypothetical protein
MGHGDVTARADYQTAHKERSTAGVNRVTAIFGVVAAVATLATAGLGVWSFVLNNTNTDLNQQVATLEATRERLQRDLDLANARVTSRDEDVERLQEENRELRLFAPPSIAIEDVHPIRNAATVTLAARGDTIKLNSDLQSFDYGPASYEPDEFEYRGDEIRLTDTFMPNLDDRVLATGDAGYATCAVGTGYSRKSAFSPSELTGLNVCLRLESGRFAAVHVVRFDKETVDLQVTVWQ